MRAAVWRNFSNRGPQAGPGGEEAAVDGRCEGGPASGGGWESVHRTTLAPLAAQNRRHVGPTILFDRPRQDPPLLASIVSFWARGRLYNRVVNIRLL
jgi:hypothetical protein